MLFIGQFFKSFLEMFDDSSSDNTDEEKLSYEYFTQGEEFLDNKNLEKAIECFDRSNQHRPFMRSYNHLGDIYLLQEEYERAIENYNEALRISYKRIYDINSYNGLSACYLALQDYEKAFKYCKQSLEIMPDAPPSNNAMASVYRAMKKYDMAIEHYEKAIGKDKVFDCPFYPDPWFDLLDLFIEMKDYPRALDFFNVFSLQLLGDFIEEGTIFELLKEEDADRFVSSLEKMLSLYKDNSQLYYDLARINYLKAEYEEVIENVKAIFKFAPENSLALIMMAAAYTRLKQYDEAQNYFERALLIDPYDRKFVNLYARMLFNSEQYDRAVEEFEKSLKLSADDNTPEMDSFDSFAFLRLGDIYKRENFADVASQSYLAVFQDSKITHLQVEAFHSLVALHYELKDYENVIKYLNQLKGLMGSAHYKLHFEKVFFEKPRNVVALYALMILTLQDYQFKQENLPERLEEIVVLRNKLKEDLFKIKVLDSGFTPEVDRILASIER